jgi:hypothetical protein
MFQLNAMEFSLRLEHRHEDGSWSQLEPRPSHHDPADHDPEREWANGRIYVCTSCSEEVRITDRSSEGGPSKP